MTFYRISIADASNDEAYWISARSEDEARRLVALNARNASRARGRGYLCEVDSTQTPPADMIYRRKNGPISIAKR